MVTALIYGVQPNQDWVNCCEQGNELSRYIQGLIGLSKKLMLHCSYIFTRAGKVTGRNINLFMSVSLSVSIKHLGSDRVTRREDAHFK